MDRIVLTGMRLEGHLGVSEEERAFPQLVEVDVELETDLGQPASSDDLAEGVDYAPIVERTREVVETGEHRLIESLAGAVADAVVDASGRVTAVVVRVRKLAVPLDIDMDHAEVELRRETGAARG